MEWRPAVDGLDCVVAGADSAATADDDAAPPAAPLHAPGLDVPLYLALWRQRTQPNGDEADNRGGPSGSCPSPSARTSDPPPLAPPWYAKAVDTSGALDEATLLLQAHEAVQLDLEMIRTSLDPTRDGDGPAPDAHTTPLPTEDAIAAYAASRGWLHLATITDPAQAEAAMERCDYALHDALRA